MLSDQNDYDRPELLSNARYCYIQSEVRRPRLSATTRSNVKYKKLQEHIEQVVKKYNEI